MYRFFEMTMVKFEGNENYLREMECEDVRQTEVAENHVKWHMLILSTSGPATSVS
jgi:hypothetical protein